MSTLLKLKTEKEAALLADDASVLEYAKALNQVASVATSIHASYWQRPTPLLLEALNDDVKLTLARFAANTAIGLAVNASLDALNAKDETGEPLFTSRCPVSMGRDDITYNPETKLFEFITLT